ncbi:MAG: hypothetical protein ACRD3M_05260, partial [Thermoanaerobaculia bacterium]
LFLFRRIAARTLPPKAVPLAVALFALSDPLIYFSSELKPYSLDVLIVLWLLALVLAARHDTSGRRSPLTGLALAGALAVWFSLPAVFVLAGAASTLAVSAWRRRDRPRLTALALTGLLWGASFAVFNAVSLSNIGRSQRVLAFWAQGFPPLPPRSLDDLYWPARAFGALFGDPGGFVFRGLGIFCFLVGASVLLESDRARLALLLSPLLLTLVASGLRLYPFEGRPILFLAPLLLLLVAEGAERIRDAASARAPAAGMILIALLLFHPVLFAARSLAEPRTREEIKPVLAYVQKRQQPGDRLYVYAAAAPAFDYYRARYGFAAGGAIVGAWAGEQEGARRDLERLRGGARTWVLFTHSERPDGSDDQKRLLPLLDGAGKRVEEFRAPGAAVYLYDMDKRPKGGARP